MNRDRLAAALAPLTSGIPAHLWRTPTRRDRARADRALARLARAEATSPAPHATRHTEGTDQ
ncbi:hypothetical protein ACFRSX_03345 [Streptomyces goshikiensis]|uniref:hypothetical protein n=1 Tax=Streptomyces TaxID=1883 RepID=UPI000C27B794|nr:hypothetical protein [Streptomyces sp. CB02120-2]PJN18909.1 hypothetical protein CG724_08845 [Streptomyces sp. CB02120-2]